MVFGNEEDIGSGDIR